MNRIFDRIGRALRHARNRTLGERLRQEIQRQKKRLTRWQAARRRSRWYRISHTRRSIEVGIGKGRRVVFPAGSELGAMVFSGGFEQPEREFVGRFLRPGDVFVDIGANVGLYTVLASSCVEPGGKVFSFEPSPNAWPWLLENIRRAGVDCVVPLNVALSDRSGTAVLYSSNSARDAWSTMAARCSAQDMEASQIETARLDDVCDEHPEIRAATLIKIDVEGWETAVLRGGAQYFATASASVLLIEFNERAARAAGSSCNEIGKRLESLGYQLFRFFGGCLVSVDLEKEGFADPENLLASRDVDLMKNRLHGGAFLGAAL